MSRNTINLVSNDAQKIEKSLNQLGMVLFAPLELVISLVILWYLIGPEVLVGAAFFFVLAAFQILMARKAAMLTAKAAAVTDKRLVTMNEIIAGIRAVKMYAWESNFKDVVNDLRSLMTIRTTFCYNLSMSMQMIADAKVALGRTQTFLEEKASKSEEIELPEEHNPDQLLTDRNVVVQCKGTKAVNMPVRFTNCSKRDDFTDETSPPCTSTAAPTVTPVISSGLFPEVSVETPVDQVTNRLLTSPHLRNSSSKEPYILISEVSCSWSQDYLTNSLRGITLNASRGDMLAITGEAGSGKSSLLAAILGELPLQKGTIMHHGKVAYVPQIPWIFSGTVRDNILFGLPYNEGKFKCVAHICGLTKDLQDLTNGDLTEIGQRGATLSGGQKARVGLARAVFSDADIYLLDDPLSAVDTKGGYKELTDNSVFSDGLELSRIFQDETQCANSVSLNQFKEVKATHVSNVKEEETSHKSLPVLQQTCDMPKTDSQVACCRKEEEEEAKTAGTVTWRVYWDYFKEGLPVPWIMLLSKYKHLCKASLHRHMNIASFGECRGTHSKLIPSQPVELAPAPNWWLARIAEMSHDQQKTPVTQVIHACLVAVSIVVMAASCFLFYYLLLKAAQNLHKKMTITTLHAPVLFFDTTPAGRILNRFSKDVGCMDDVLPSSFLQAVVICLSSLFAMLVPAATNYWIFLALLPVIAILVYYARYYLKSSRELKRIEAIRFSPVYSHITQTLDGLEIVHTSNMKGMLLDRLQRKQDENSQAFFMVVSCTRWLSIRLDLLSSVFVTIVAVALMLITNNPVEFGRMITAATPIFNKEKVGVVGRTGAGKSSLVSALFRMPEPSGKVTIDGVNIASLDLQEARKSIAVITQDPVLFGGTLKKNLDPFSQHTEQDLWRALEEVQLKTLVEGLPGQLEFKLKESGTNLSVGERQLLCLARALFQKSKIIIMDEATANVDFKTDRLIQDVIRHKFKDSTVLTIAHRLNTIMDYDKVLVLDGGRVAEFDKPEVLIRKGGLFAEMVRSQKQSIVKQ
ncbi:hypothetical protein ACROYT_G015835 [Oculina patagonica]